MSDDVMAPTIHPYYAARKPQIVAEFLENVDLVAAEFTAQAPAVALMRIKLETVEEMENVFPTIPYVFGEIGRMTTFFEQNVGIIALGRVLRRHGLGKKAISLLLRRTFLARLSSLPKEDRFALGRQWLSEKNQAYLRVMAPESEKRGNPGDFVYAYVEGGDTEDGDRFEFGLDYHECGFCKLCKSNGDEDLLPMMCAMDDEVYGLRGVKLFRTTTLAGGDKKCNFRFRAMTDDEAAEFD